MDWEGLVRSLIEGSVLFPSPWLTPEPADHQSTRTRRILVSYSLVIHQIICSNWGEDKDVTVLKSKINTSYMHVWCEIKYVCVWKRFALGSGDIDSMILWKILLLSGIWS